MLMALLACLALLNPQTEELTPSQREYLANRTSGRLIWYYSDRAAYGITDFGLNQETRAILRSIDREIEQEEKEARDWILPLVPRTLRAKFERDIIVASGEAFAQRAEEHLPDDFTMTITRYNFQLNYLRSISEDGRLHSLLGLSEEQVEKVQTFVRPPSDLKRIEANSRYRFQYRPREFANEDGTETKSREMKDRTEVRIWELIDEDQRETVSNLCGPPFDNGWLEYVLNENERAESRE